MSIHQLFASLSSLFLFRLQSLSVVSATIAAHLDMRKRRAKSITAIKIVEPARHSGRSGEAMRRRWQKVVWPGLLPPRPGAQRGQRRIALGDQSGGVVPLCIIEGGRAGVPIPVVPHVEGLLMPDARLTPPLYFLGERERLRGGERRMEFS